MTPEQDDTLRRAFWQRIGRDSYTTTTHWLTERQGWVLVAGMPMRQLVNTLQYVERHAAHVLAVDWSTATPKQRGTVRSAAQRWCPVYSVMQVEARGRKHPTAPGLTPDTQKKLKGLQKQIAARGATRAKDVQARWAATRARRQGDSA